MIGRGSRKDHCPRSMREPVRPRERGAQFGTDQGHIDHPATKTAHPLGNRDARETERIRERTPARARIVGEETLYAVAQHLLLVAKRQIENRHVRSSFRRRARAKYRASLALPDLSCGNRDARSS